MGIRALRIASLRERVWKNGTAQSSRINGLDASGVVDQQTLRNSLARERRRSERSRNPFMLMLLDVTDFARDELDAGVLPQIIRVITSHTRETDLLGWYEDGQVLGIIFTELVAANGASAPEAIKAKIEKALHHDLGLHHAKRIAISVHIFPRIQNGDSSTPLADPKLYSDLHLHDGRKRSSLAMKRVIDLLGSSFLLLLLSPLFALIALAIKLSSAGPVLFKQERLGQFGSRFQCFKFRTMYINNDPKIHQEYAKRFIASNCAHQEAGDKPVYKITRDPRVTWVGRWLRKASLDELPQFWNVFRREMSLVGPRPPVFYEFELYDYWHQRRVLELKPGVTGLWQISGRSRTNFDDMVRLDLRYHRTWSVWLDIRILLRTPFAVIFGEGAY